MTNTHFQDDHTELISNKAYGYRVQNGRFHSVNNGLTALGSSSLYSTIDDLAKWVINLDNPKIGGKPVVNRMFQRGILNDGSQISYAYGLDISEYHGIKKISHSGSWASFSTYLAYFPEQHLSIVVLQNFPANALKVANDLADIYLADQFVLKGSDINQEKLVPDFVDVPVSILDKYVGKYRLDITSYMTIFRSGDQLKISVTSEDLVPLIATSDSTFWAYNSPIGFYKNDSGNIAGLYYRELACPKIKPGDTPLSELTGEYISRELKTIYDISIENDRLVAKHIQNGTIVLTPVGKDDFEGGIWYMGSVQFYRDAKGEVEGFMVTTNRSRKQRFVKQNIIRKTNDY